MNTKTLIVILLAASSALGQTPPDGSVPPVRVDAPAPSSALSGTSSIPAQCSGDQLARDKNGTQACQIVTDSTPASFLLKAHASAPLSTAGNQTGSSIIMRSGEGIRTMVVTAASFVNNTTTVTVRPDGTAVTGTEGTAFECDSVTNTVCATNIAAWIVGLSATDGITACAGAGCTLFTGVAGTVYVWPDPSEPAKFVGNLACSTGAAATITNGANGAALLYGQSLGITLDGQLSNTFYLAPTGSQGQAGIVTTATGTALGTWYANSFVIGSSNGSASTALANASNGFQYGSTGSYIMAAGGTGTSGATTGKIRGEWFQLAWTNASLAACGAGTACDITMGTLAAKMLVKRAFVSITTAAAGPATLTISCGRTGAGFNDWTLANSAKSAADTLWGDNSDGSESGAGLFATFWRDDLPSWTTTTAIKCHFISTVADVNTTTNSSGTLNVLIEAVL